MVVKAEGCGALAIFLPSKDSWIQACDFSISHPNSEDEKGLDLARPGSTDLIGEGLSSTYRGGEEFVCSLDCLLCSGRETVGMKYLDRSSD